MSICQNLSNISKISAFKSTRPYIFRYSFLWYFLWYFWWYFWSNFSIFIFQLSQIICNISVLLNQADEPLFIYYVLLYMACFVTLIFVIAAFLVLCIYFVKKDRNIISGMLRILSKFHFAPMMIQKKYKK